MPTPTNAPSTQTATPSQQQNPALFAELTERQAMPQTVQAIAGLGKSQRLTVEKVGVISRIRLLVKCSFTPSTEKELILNPGFPWKLIQEIALQANGVTGIIDCSGVTLEQRRRKVFRNPVSAIFKSPKVGEKLKKEKQEVEFVVDIPIAHDMLSLIGSLLAQNEETGLTLKVTWASEEEVASAAGKGVLEKFEGEVIWGATVFSIGSTTIGGKEVTILPDLSAFHGIVQTETPLTGTGQRKGELIRTSGQLLALTATILNKPGGQEESSPAEWTTFFLEYGGNKKPLVWTPASELLEENADDYDGPINVQGLHFLVVDNERDNPTRDMIIPESLTEFRAVIGVPAAFKPENAQILTTQEFLYPAV
jgi:hypothetical protein